MNEIKDLYIELAESLGFKDNITCIRDKALRNYYVELCANAYIDATTEGDEFKRSQYISALMLLFWGEAGRMYGAIKGYGVYSYEDCISKLYECIEAACGYAAWKDGSSSASNCINQVISSRGLRYFLYELGLDKNKANVFMSSLDTELDDDSDSTRVSLVDSGDGDSSDYVENGAEKLIQTYIDENKIVEAIILDNIAFNDTEKVEKETTKAVEKSYSTEQDMDTLDFNTVEADEEVKTVQETASFWAYKLVQALNNLPTSYAKYFRGKYSVKAKILAEALAKVKASNNQKLYKYINATLADAKDYGNDLRAYMERN